MIKIRYLYISTSSISAEMNSRYVLFLFILILITQLIRIITTTLLHVEEKPNVANDDSEFEETIAMYLKGRDQGMSPQEITKHIFNVSRQQTICSAFNVKICQPISNRSGSSSIFTFTVYFHNHLSCPHTLTFDFIYFFSKFTMLSHKI